VGETTFQAKESSRTTSAALGCLRECYLDRIEAMDSTCKMALIATPLKVKIWLGKTLLCDLPCRVYSSIEREEIASGTHSSGMDDSGSN
jgi:hypothetical protein